VVSGGASDGGGAGAGEFSVTVLGCSGSYPGAGAPSTGYLVRHGATAVWLDAGAGTFAELQRHVEVADLTAVVLTHAHVDHWADLAQLRTVLRYFRPDLAGLAVYGTAATHDLAAHLVGGTLDDAFAWTTITADSAVVTGSLRWSFSLTDHPVETLAVRADTPDDRSFGFSADTGPGWSPVGLGPGLDLFLCEASLDDADADIVAHLTGRQAGAGARAAGVGRLVITHVLPGLDGEVHRGDAEHAFGAPVALAAPGATYPI